MHCGITININKQEPWVSLITYEMGCGFMMQDCIPPPHKEEYVDNIARIQKSKEQDFHSSHVMHCRKGKPKPTKIKTLIN